MKLLILFLFLSFSVGSYASDASVVIEENNFYQLAQQMKQEKRGLVLMLHAENCPYCRLMDDDILSPMVRSGEYDKRIFIRKLLIDAAGVVTDFSGNRVEPSKISSHYNVSLTPTLVFLDHQGKEMSEQMVGINTVELFGAYVDREIDSMMMKLNSQKTAQ